MAVIGVIGGIACGKSFVAGLFKSLGAEVIDADRIGHEVLLETEVRDALVDRWGPEILEPGGGVRRAAVAERVFSKCPDGKGDLEFLEGLVHPRIADRVRDRIASIARDRPGTVVVLDAALLIEAEWAGFCDKLVFVDVPREQRLARAKTRGWSEKEFEARESAQANLALKRKQADWVMDNSGSAEHTFAQVQQFWGTLN